MNSATYLIMHVFYFLMTDIDIFPNVSSRWILNNLFYLFSIQISYILYSQKKNYDKISFCFFYYSNLLRKTLHYVVHLCILHMSNILIKSIYIIPKTSSYHYILAQNNYFSFPWWKMIYIMQIPIYIKQIKYHI